MVICWSKEVPLDDLVEVLYKRRILEKLDTIQKVKYGKMYALASEHSKVLEDLVLNGLDVGYIHLEFTYHKANQVTVYVINIPYGISKVDINRAFSGFGSYIGARQIKRKFRGIDLFTGDWILTFNKLDKPIPSYVVVRGWWAYVKYTGQESTCCKCNQVGHVVANCPQRQREETKFDETPRHGNEEHSAEPEDITMHEPPPPNEPDLSEEERKSTPTMQGENPELYKPPQDDPGYSNAFQEILENLESSTKDELSHVTVEDCQIPTTVESEVQLSEETSKNQSQAWADSKEESSTHGSEKPQEKSKMETKVKTKVGPMVYCPYCQVDSHTEVQCDKVSSARQTAKRKLGKKDSKPSRSESLGKKRRNIQGFKADIESIVLRGNKSSDVQYILESDDPENFYALWLVSRYGHRLTALSARNLFITRNTRVMELWSQYSGENMNRFATNEHLMRAHEQF